MLEIKTFSSFEIMQEAGFKPCLAWCVRSGTVQFHAEAICTDWGKLKYC
jgi:hypothetical protein